MTERVSFIVSLSKRRGRGEGRCYLSLRLAWRKHIPSKRQKFLPKSPREQSLLFRCLKIHGLRTVLLLLFIIWVVWDVTCVIGLLFPDVSRDRSAFIFSLKRLKPSSFFNSWALQDARNHSRNDTASHHSATSRTAVCCVTERLVQFCYVCLYSSGLQFHFCL
jgi:hypothetical protein